MNPITPVITINITSFESAKLSREDKDNKKCNNNWGCFRSHWKKPWAVAFAFFPKIC